MSGQENFPSFSHLIHIRKTAEYRERASQKLAELTWLGLSSFVSLAVHYLHFIREQPCPGSNHIVYVLLSVFCLLHHHQLLCGHVKIPEM